MPPKKIYRHKFTDENGVVHTVTRHIKTGDKDIEYIRADIVVKAIHGAKRQLVSGHDRDKGALDALSVLNKFLALTGHE